MIIRKYKEENNIKIFDEVKKNHSDYNAKGLDILFAQEEKHFWFIARKEYILQNFTKYIKKHKKIIEIGAGTGNVSRFLKRNGYDNISVGEMHLSGLEYAKNYGIKDCYQFDLLNTPFEKEFDVICMFDVLEHIENDSLALQNVHKSLSGGGNIVISVPSHMWLWNRDDAIAGHKIRYTRKELVEKLENNGFNIVEAKYFFMSIVPLLFLRKLLNSDSKNIVQEKEYDNDISMNSILSKILLYITRIENKIYRFLPNLFGGSLFIIAKKNDTI